MTITLNGTTGITTADIAATTITTADIAATTLSINAGYGSNAAAYGCRAWVNFNGTGTVAIRESGNVSSITDNGVGDYTVNFTTAMVDANYSAVCNSSSEAITNSDTMVNPYTWAVGSVMIGTNNSSGLLVDRSQINVVVLR